MKYFGVFDDTGTMIRYGKCQEEVIHNQAREGQISLELPYKPLFNIKFILVDGEIIEVMNGK